ncbi:Ctr copper transporter family-domain-containing protein [Radiomyces spectabilis]|uniref:Ctr copper transporter family-domain-containing protein n=1 Tax=Radiomyces spectabilis TaxID=64574 RepID=UPI002220E4BB|nr:Ctr copper transporter family-domain-containing protein [Radiomyces spectabilis]KAI8394061.1 Ctr copper transporter family-domain-containing protein [Radiomyces spectabilis]
MEGHAGCSHHAAGQMGDMANMGHMGHMAMGHEGHTMPDMPDMSDMCNMNMIFNWQVKNVCVVFEWWHIHTALGLLLSCAAVFAIAAGYEYLRVYASSLDQRYKLANAKKQAAGNAARIDSSEPSESEGLLHGFTKDGPSLSKQQAIMRSVMYAFLMAISFWLMLVFMTYNGYLMIATILGAGFGHYFFGQGRLNANRSISCH